VVFPAGCWKRRIAYREKEPRNWCVRSACNGAGERQVGELRVLLAAEDTRGGNAGDRALFFEDYGVLRSIAEDLKRWGHWADRVIAITIGLGKCWAKSFVRGGGRGAQPGMAVPTRKIEIFTTRIDTILWGCALVLAPTHPLSEIDLLDLYFFRFGEERE